MMSDLPEHKTFTELLNAPFRVQLDDGQSIETKLVEVSEQKLTDRQEMFSILFRGPTEALLEQGIYRLQQERTGDFELFLTPVRQDEQGFYYEAAFNLIRQANPPAA